jgi:hypothetical protein
LNFFLISLKNESRPADFDAPDGGFPKKIPSAEPDNFKFENSAL